MSSYTIQFNLEFQPNTQGGLFVDIEGIDGSGKTTQARNVVKLLQQMGYKKVLYTKEPTDEPTGRFIRQILRGEITVPPVSLQYLYGADRAQHLELIKRYLQDDYIVVSDRYFWSAVAYGMADMREPIDFYLIAFSLLSFYHRFILPDISIYLQISPEVALQRIASSHKHTEMYDKQEKLPAIAKSYEQLIERFKQEFTIVDGEKKIEQVSQEIIAIIEKRKAI